MKQLRLPNGRFSGYSAEVSKTGKTATIYHKGQKVGRVRTSDLGKGTVPERIIKASTSKRSYPSKIIHQEKNITAVQRGGWVHVRANINRGKSGARWIEKNVRSSWYREIMKNTGNRYQGDHAKRFRDALAKENPQWAREIAGSNRLRGVKQTYERVLRSGKCSEEQMEDILEELAKIEKAIKDGDAAASRYYDDWVDRHEDTIREFYAQSDEFADSGTVVV